MPKSDRRQAYWRANLKLIFSLLGVWAFVSLVCGILFVEVLNQVQFFGLPLGFWVAQQGSILTFVGLIFIYAFQMDKLDQRYRDRAPAITPSTMDAPNNRERNYGS